jgi:hypothetical protein
MLKSPVGIRQPGFFVDLTLITHKLIKINAERPIR